MRLSQNAIKVLEARYLRRDARRRIVETPEELFESVARGVAEAELLLGGSRQAAHWQEIFLRLLSSLDFLPNTPTLMNAGKPLGQLSACFVLPVEDSMEDIFESVKQTARGMQAVKIPPRVSAPWDCCQLQTRPGCREMDPIHEHAFPEGDFPPSF